MEQTRAGILCGHRVRLLLGSGKGRGLPMSCTSGAEGDLRLKSKIWYKTSFGRGWFSAPGFPNLAEPGSSSEVQNPRSPAHSRAVESECAF